MSTQDDFNQATQLLWLAYCEMDDDSPLKRRIFKFMQERAPSFIAGYDPDRKG